MGKCLSCCPATQSVSSQNNEDKFSDVSRKSDTIEHQPGMSSGDMRRTEKSYSETQIVTNSNAEFNSNSKNLSLTEKLMFHPRMPPILSSSCSDNKRSSHSSREYSESRIISFFEQYKDPVENAILADGIERLCNDLNVCPEDFRVLLLAWKFNAQHMFCFTKEEFVEGCRNLKSDSVLDVQQKFQDMVTEVRDPERFKDFYRFTFKFGLEPGQRVLMSEMAIQLWKLVFYDSEPPILHRWLSFLEKHPSVRGISRDTWNMFLNFSESVGDDLSSYDDTAAWPSLFDDFVEFENDQTNQNVVSSKDKSILDV